MIKDIPFSFKDKNEDYFVLGSLQTFCKNCGLPTTLDKVELISKVLEYANENEENEIAVLQWIDQSLKEGIKKLILSKIMRSSELMNRKIEEWEKLLNTAFGIKTNSFIVGKEHKNELELCGYEFEVNNDIVEKVSLNYTILLKEEKNKGVFPTIIYPIFIDIDLVNKYIIGRAKSKTSLYKFNIIGKDEEELKSTTYEKLINEALLKTMSSLELDEESRDLRNHKFKSIIHLIVDECTKTPDEIISKISIEDTIIKDFVQGFLTRQNINLIAENNYNNAIEDIRVFMEKYISINYEDKGIFTNDRYAYPVQISATDSDFSSVDESTSDDKPLQCTPIFFDNKKLIQREKKCDNVVLIFKKEQKLYFTEKNFPVILEVKKDRMYIDFRKYTLEEDIKNVLSRIIRDNK